MRARHFAKMDSSTEACGSFGITYCGGGTPSFLTPEEPFCACVVREVSLISGMVILSLYSSRAQLLTLTLALECLGEKKLQFHST